MLMEVGDDDAWSSYRTVEQEVEHEVKEKKRY
jgi:hypothetical protein